MLTAKDRKISKKTIKHILVALVLLLLFSGILALFVRTHSFPKATTNEIRIGDEIYNLANYQNIRQMVELGTYDGKLYFYFTDPGNHTQTPYGNRVCCFEDGGIRKVKKLGYRRYGITFIGDTFYYNSYGRQSGLYAYSLSDGKDEYRSKKRGGAVIRLTNDGEICMPVLDPVDYSRMYYNLSRFEECDNQSHELGYGIGERKYWIGEHNDELFEYAAGEITEVPLTFAEERRIIPVSNGLLVHNYGFRDLLYFIDEAGEITCLFSLDEGMSSRSAVNVHGDDVYLSLIRYAGFNDIFLKRYENDEKEGLYRISLRDHSVEKISDHIYNGLYNFDDAYLYATDDEYNIYQLDFDGNIVDVLLKVKEWYEG